MLLLEHSWNWLQENWFGKSKEPCRTLGWLGLLQTLQLWGWSFTSCCCEVKLGEADCCEALVLRPNLTQAGMQPAGSMWNWALLMAEGD